MRDLMTEVNTLFELCEEANAVLKVIDARAQYNLMTKIQKQSQMVFVLLENAVNPMGKKDLLKEIPDRNTLIKLYYVILKSLHYFSKSGVSYFEGPRSQGSAMLAHKLIKELDFEHKFGAETLWINNKIIFTKGIMVGMQRVHPTLLQNMVRCISATFVYPEIKDQKVYEYMGRFESNALYYLMQCPPEERIYLDFV